ncbi:MAG TPA: bifunctional phosphoglucose/phosphomannose isomerase [Patescibacteria group bacterium]|nr:bifunctional phosphoglucose/phosphomannose isomerase [Patescibacteria group bacterium]
MATSILDSRKDIGALDVQNVLGSIEHLPDQIEHAWSDTKAIQVSDAYKKVHKIVVSGMGGSALGAHVIKTLFKDTLKQPLEIVNHYELPEYVDKDTLVVLSSYSGTTEETLISAEDAKKRGAKIAVITAGGKLEEFANKEGCLLYKIVPAHNPSNQPRMAIGYSVFGQLGLFNAMGLISIFDSEVAELVALLRKNAKLLNPDSKEKNTAKFLAYSAFDKMVALIGAEHLEGALHVFNNQLNENAKNFTDYLVVPELNHHYMESLSFPKHMKDSVLFLVFNSNLYSPRVQKRIPLTIDVINQNGFTAEMVQTVWKTKMQQVWEAIQLGAFTNFYLAMLNGINPAPIPWVDYFKKKLGK